MVNNWLSIIQDFLFPPTCILCNAPGFRRWDLCAACYQQLPWATHQCPQCAATLMTNLPTDLPCGQCLAQPPAFDSALAVCRHQHTMRYLIAQLKFNQQYVYAKLLGLLLTEVIWHQNQSLPQAIIPMPLHPRRYQVRGFNQSIAVARVVAQQLQLPLLLTTCIRHKDTQQQSRLTRKQRQNNVRGSFRVVKPLIATHVAIIDDVMTTGATAHELATVLKQAGAQRVDVWLCSRA